MNIQKFMHKPTFVEGVLVNRENMDEVAAWCGGFPSEGQKYLKGPVVKCIKVEVLRPHHPRQTMAFYGDWVIKTESGWKVYTSKAFYEKFLPAKKPEDFSESALSLMEDVLLSESERHTS